MNRLLVHDGPSLRATPFEELGNKVAMRLLTPRQRHELESLSTRMTYQPGASVYREHAQNAAIFICEDGALKAYRDLPSGKRRVMSFLFAGDLFGLSESGRYLNTVQALTKSVCFCIPREQLVAVLRRDSELEFHFLCKVVHELRALQLRSIMMGHRSASGRVSMFLTMLEKHLPDNSPRHVLPLPMSRSDIAGYLGLSPEAVSRAAKDLVEAGIIDFRGGHEVRILDRKRLERLAADV
jgi:CRP/FNR family transcriptional regulator